MHTIERLKAEAKKHRAELRRTQALIEVERAKHNARIGWGGRRPNQTGRPRTGRKEHRIFCKPVSHANLKVRATSRGQSVPDYFDQEFARP